MCLFSVIIPLFLLYEIRHFFKFVLGFKVLNEQLQQTIQNILCALLYCHCHKNDGHKC
jgi:hypothetical protein